MASSRTDRKSPFVVRGVVEGFYGPPYTFPERDDLITWMGRHGLNAYLYGPKNDWQHRNRWREPYPTGVLAQFAHTVRAAASAGVEFAYALSPSVSICYSDPDEFALITAKLGAFYELGVRAFSLFFDDITPTFRHAADAAVYGSFAEAHANLCNRLFRWLKALDPACSLSMCPTEYHGVAPFGAYLWELGERLAAEIDVFYTGSEVCSATIGVAEVRAFGEAVRRSPLLWDNYPVNDLAMRHSLHLGPLRGRDPELGRVVQGVLFNPMVEAEASKLALQTGAAYLEDPEAYQPDEAWQQALASIVGAESAHQLRRFAENSWASPFRSDEAEELSGLVADLSVALELKAAGTIEAKAAALRAYLAKLDEASYHLKNRIGNLALRANLLPWLEACDVWVELGRELLRAVEAQQRGAAAPQRLERLLAQARSQQERYGAQALAALAERMFAAKGG